MSAITCNLSLMTILTGCGKESGGEVPTTIPDATEVHTAPTVINTAEPPATATSTPASTAAPIATSTSSPTSTIIATVTGGTQFTKAGIIGHIFLEGNHHVRGTTVHLLPGFNVGTVVHEVAHVLDNYAAGYALGALFGGGFADEMARFLCADPTQCLCIDPRECNRSVCPNYFTPGEPDFPSTYAGSGPSEDFAESFRFSVLSPHLLGPNRSAFIDRLGQSLVTSVGQFQGSPYSNLDRHGVTSPSGGGGDQIILPHLLQ
jgi:hypothetical protein